MRYRLLGRSGLRVSELCLGTMTFGDAWGWGADKDASRAQYEAYREAGGNFIDTANFYTGGQSEEIIGDLMQGHREQIVLATKFTLFQRQGDPNSAGNGRKSMMDAVHASLKRLKTDYIDLYWVHAWDQMTPIDELMRGFDDLVRQGKILYAGVSDFPAWKVAQVNTLAELQGWTRFVGLQVPYSLTRRDIERELVPAANSLGLGITPWGPLDGGALTGKCSRKDLDDKTPADPTKPAENRSGMVKAGLTERKLEIADKVKEVAERIGKTPSQVALRWVMQQPGVTSTILGARTLKKLQDNLGAREFELDASTLDELHEASKIDLGFPTDFLNGPNVTQFMGGGVHVEGTRGL